MNVALYVVGHSSSGRHDSNVENICWCKLYYFFFLLSLKLNDAIVWSSFEETEKRNSLYIVRYSLLDHSSYRIPSGTSPELTALLTGLLRRNAKDRMEFDDFFNHSFIRKSQTQPTTPPLPVPNLARLSTPPKTPPVTVPTRPVTTTPASQNNNATTPEEADDFVLVPSPSQLRGGSRGVAVDGINQNEGDTQPLPVPSQRDAFIKVCIALEFYVLLFTFFRIFE